MNRHSFLIHSLPDFPHICHLYIWLFRLLFCNSIWDSHNCFFSILSFSLILLMKTSFSFAFSFDFSRFYFQSFQCENVNCYCYFKLSVCMCVGVCVCIRKKERKREWFQFWVKLFFSFTQFDKCHTNANQMAFRICILLNTSTLMGNLSKLFGPHFCF